MSTLVEKLRRARERNVEAGGHVFTVRRPTDLEAAGLGSHGDLLDYVVGWDLRGADLLPDGGPEPAPFETEVFREWIADRPDLWGPLTDAVREAYAAHVAAREERAKN